jgi:hypothetical protein
MPTTSTPSRSPLQFAASAVTVAVAIYSRIHLVVPFLLACAIWGLMQRSKRPERRWISAAFAVPAGFVVGLLLVALLRLSSVALLELIVLSVMPAWLIIRSGRVPLMIQIALQSVLVCLFLASVFRHPSWGSEVLRIVVADLYFCVATIVASILALRRGPGDAANGGDRHRAGPQLPGAT